MKKLKQGERCLACERLLAEMEGGPIESLQEFYDSGNHICEHPQPRFVSLAGEIGMLVEEKNAVYGDSAAQYQTFLTLLWPNGIPPSSYRDAGLMLRVFDKFMRIATDRDGDGENPWNDAVGYTLIGAAEKRK